MKLQLSFIALAFGISSVSFAQQNDTTKQIQQKYKNIIRFNIASAAIFKNAIIFGYERVVSPHQSFSINIGTTGLGGGEGSNDSISKPLNLKTSGFNFSADYRFYLAKENKYASPHGVYIGPYYSYNGFKRENSFDFLQQDGSSKNIATKVNFNIHTVGLELGYQFVLWKRLALDFVVVGPGVSSYSVKTTIQNNLTAEQKQKVQDAIVKAMERFPGLGHILNKHPLNSSGSMNTTDFGYRYLVHIGFLF